MKMQNGLVMLGLTLCYACFADTDVTYDELAKMSNLIVVAQPLANRDTTNRWTTQHVTPGNVAVEVETRFLILGVLKGDLTGSEFVLSHYRWAGPNPMANLIVAGPRSFAAGSTECYLMFLRREPTGRIVTAVSEDTVHPIKRISDTLGTISPNVYRSLWIGK